MKLPEYVFKLPTPQFEEGACQESDVGFCDNCDFLQECERGLFILRLQAEKTETKKLKSCRRREK